MFNGFSAIEQLLKMATAHMPEFEKLIVDAQKEYLALSKFSKQSAEQTDNGACEYCGNNCWKVVCETCGEESAG